MVLYRYPLDRYERCQILEKHNDVSAIVTDLLADRPNWFLDFLFRRRCAVASKGNNLKAGFEMESELKMIIVQEA